MLTDGQNVFIPDKTFTRQVEPKRYVANFGDGYQQRISAGINPINEEISASFRTRPKEEIDDLIDWLTHLRGVTAFTMEIPNTNGDETIRVVAESWNKVYEYDDYYSATVRMRRVYE